MTLLFGPVPSDGEQTIVLVLAVIFGALAVLFWGSVARRWWEGLKQIPSAYRRGRETASKDRNDDSEE